MGSDTPSAAGASAYHLAQPDLKLRARPGKASCPPEGERAPPTVAGRKGALITTAHAEAAPQSQNIHVTLH